MFFNRKSEKEDEYEKKLDEYSKGIRENINKNQDWLYPIMSAIALGGISQLLPNIEKFGAYKIYAVLLIGSYVIVLWLIIANFFFHSKIMEAVISSENPEETYTEKLCKLKCIASFIDAAFWLLTISILLTFVLYVISGN